MTYIVTIGQRKHAVLKLAELFCAMHCEDCNPDEFREEVES